MSEEEQNIIKSYMNWSRNRAATIGDKFLRQRLMGDVQTHRRVEQIYSIFCQWCDIEGRDRDSEKVRTSIADKLANVVNLSVMTFRRNVYLAKNDVDLRNLETDIKYLEALRSLGTTALTSAVNSLLGDICGNSRRTS